MSRSWRSRSWLLLPTTALVTLSQQALGPAAVGPVVRVSAPGRNVLADTHAEVEPLFNKLQGTRWRRELVAAAFTGVVGWTFVFGQAAHAQPLDPAAGRTFANARDRAIGLQGLNQGKLKPETGIKRSNLGLMEGTAGSDGSRLIAVELLSTPGPRVTISFQTTYKLKSDRGGRDNAIEVGSPATGEAAYVQVLPTIGVEDAGRLTNDAVLGGVLGPKGKFGSAKPEEIVVISSEVRSGRSPQEPLRRLIMARFTTTSQGGRSLQTRAIISAAVVEGDAFLMVGTARESTWDETEKNIRAVVYSFRAEPNSAFNSQADK
ncbi:unnamed protein product [Polarella glacialis]|uniref:Uncharacterized protein n=1 Tax=Polarella glacialis TaxID=89957 RepID=A0A813LQM0_POLGL|nr:unnamed protein product [Polarella glacialis]